MAWKVSKEESGLKLVSFIQTKTPLSAKKIKQALDRGACRINNRVERFASFAVGAGDIVDFTVPEERKLEPVLPLYEDDTLLIVNKPSHMTSEEVGKKSGFPLVHRLDIETSGCLALAKTEAALLNLTEQFRNRTVQKEYLAWVDGTPSPASGVVENQLGKLKVYQGQTLWGAVKQGSYAKTSWSVVKTKDNKSLVLCRPETGRTHQIRIHLADLGHPILGDSTYGKRFRSPYRPSRILLHASKLSFTHPKTSLPLAVEAPLPKAFQELM